MLSRRLLIASASAAVGLGSVPAQALVAEPLASASTRTGNSHVPLLPFPDRVMAGMHGGLRLVGCENGCDPVPAVRMVLGLLSNFSHDIRIFAIGDGLASGPLDPFVWYASTRMQPIRPRHEIARDAMRISSYVIVFDRVDTPAEAEIALRAAMCGHLVVAGIVAKTPDDVLARFTALAAQGSSHAWAHSELSNALREGDYIAVDVMADQGPDVVFSASKVMGKGCCLTTVRPDRPSATRSAA